MVGYRCYILDAEDHILQAYEVECADDAQAATAAGDLLARDPYHRSVEVWQRARRIAKLERESAAGPRSARCLQQARRVVGSVD
jgi:hypothetical protein